MSHYFCGVVVPMDTTRETAESAVEPLMEPFRESDELDSGWWDFWLVGGRWTGVWSHGYKPERDHRNYGEPCFICGGTGSREDIGEQDRQQYIAWLGGCNACYGTGSAMNWDRAPFVGDVITVDFLLSGWTCRTWDPAKPEFSLLLPYRIVLPDGTSQSKERWLIDGEYSDHWRDGKSRESSDIPDDEWDAVVRAALAPWSGHKIVAVDYHA